MPTVQELSAPYENFMLSPRPGPGVCSRCFNFTDGYERCYACDHIANMLAAIVPISYSIAGEQLHHALAAYKRHSDDAARRLALGIAAVLWRFLASHERCVARAANVTRFPVVTAVPSSIRALDRRHRLSQVVAELVGPVRTRYRVVLRRSTMEVAPREFHPEKYVALRPLNGEPVLLIDDTWTTGANAQSAAAALRAAGAGPIAAVVVGRHVNRDWRENDRRLRSIPPFDWRSCVICRAAARAPALDPATRLKLRKCS